MVALTHNATWDLVPLSPSQNVVGCKWIFRIKRNQHGHITQYKARLVARVGFHQCEGQPTTVRIVLSFVVSNRWSIRQILTMPSYKELLQMMYTQSNLWDLCILNTLLMFVNLKNPYTDLNKLLVLGI